MTCRFPFPLIGGDRIKPYHLLQYLIKGHSVTLVCLYQGIDNSILEYKQKIEELGVKVIPIRLSLLTSFVTILFSFFKSIPLEVLYYFQPTMKRTVDELLRNNQFDLAIAFFMRTAEYIRTKDIRKILIAEDCRYEYQKRSAQTSSTFIQKFIRNWEHKKLAIYEKQVMNDFDCNTFVTNEDISYVKKLNPNANYALLTNGFDTKRFTYVPFTTERKNALFVGKLDVWVNEMMVRRLVETIMPQIRKEFPDFCLTIVGGNPSKKLHRYLQTFPFVTLNANVADVVPFLHSHSVFIHPHSGATGIQNKVIEAMATGIPIVTTVSGIQGITVINRKHTLISTSIEEMYTDVIELLQNPQLAQSLSEEARKLIETTHTWEAVYTAFETIITSVVK